MNSELETFAVTREVVIRMKLTLIAHNKIKSYLQMCVTFHFKFFQQNDRKKKKICIFMFQIKFSRFFQFIKKKGHSARFVEMINSKIVKYKNTIFFLFVNWQTGKSKLKYMKNTN